MAPDPPLTRLVLVANSVADDVGFVALGDLVSVVGVGQASYRVIGGHMVTALVARWGLGADPCRETGDTDLVTTEVPGLAAALQRPSVELDLEMHRLNDTVIHAQISFPGASIPVQRVNSDTSEVEGTRAADQAIRDAPSRDTSVKHS